MLSTYFWKTFWQKPWKTMGRKYFSDFFKFSTISPTMQIEIPLFIFAVIINKTWIFFYLLNFLETIVSNPKFSWKMCLIFSQTHWKVNFAWNLWNLPLKILRNMCEEVIRKISGRKHRNTLREYRKEGLFIEYG